VAVVEASTRDEADIRRLFHEARERFGAVDILVNNAGGLWIEQDLAELDAAHLRQTVEPEVIGTVLCIREALAGMRARRWGRIVNIGLHREVMDALLCARYRHTFDRYPYDFVVAKHAKEELTRVLAPVELKHGITVNNVLPGVIEEHDPDELARRAAAGPPPTPLVDPLDVARVVAWLCGEEARAVTGSDLRVPGNVYARL
jgi:NAD(P)-dependent dehydrogenase (short-subunit alcohol dehydrogenase family)